VIEWIRSKNNMLVPIVDGKALTSKVDPMREAQSWSSRILEEVYEDTDIVVILGIGAGYHIDVLSDKTDRHIVALDFMEEFVNKREDKERVKHYYIKKKEDVWFQQTFQALGDKRWQVFLHGPSISSLKSSYFQLRDYINLRTLDAVSRFEQVDGAIKFHSNIKLKDDANGLIDLKESVKTLSGKTNRSAYIWKALEEICK
tara:strand:- start:9491 stop:10093 length:603 start_codon:yes stop_codon:yes gene_type:complete